MTKVMGGRRRGKPVHGVHEKMTQRDNFHNVLNRQSDNSLTNCFKRRTERERARQAYDNKKE
jgi:hypothetical protein